MIELETLADEKERVTKIKQETKEGFTEMCKSVKRWTAYVNEFFMMRAKSFLDDVVKKALGIEHYWARVEFAPGCGQIHLHLLAIAKNKAYLTNNYKAKTKDEKVKAVAEYAEKVLDMTADVEVDNRREYKPVRVESPLLSKYFQVIDTPTDQVGPAKTAWFINAMTIASNQPKMVSQENAE